ncbi:MAG: DUF421 domain-containing protein [Bacilli bacterium]|nr:DUF421 domain-containing protein [Bacilli bacterium]
MYFSIIFKTILLYFFIVISYRIMGKKEIGKLSIIDLIVSILIAELAAISIEQYESSIFISIIPILCLVIIEVLFSYVGMKNPKFRKLVEGSPVVIIKNGKLNFEAMSKMRYSLDDLISQLREQSIKNIEEVNYAVLENNGKLSVFEKETEYPLPIILDGKIDEEVLKDMNKDEKWVHNILKKNNITLENVFYAFYTKNKTYIIKKQN